MIYVRGELDREGAYLEFQLRREGLIRERGQWLNREGSTRAFTVTL